MARTGRQRWLGMAAAAAVLCAGCGTTVRGSGQRAAGDDLTGLSTSSAAPSATTESQETTRPGVGTSGAAGPAGGSSLTPTGSGGVAGPGGSDGGGIAPATTVDHSTLTIGLTYTDNSGSTAALGASTSQTASQKSVAEALVKGFNAAGGLAGRKLKAIEFSFDAQGSDYSTQAQAACARFTQDHHVSLVLDTAFGLIGGFRDCLQRAGVVDITTQDEGDRTSSANAFLHANTAAMNVDREYAAVLLGMTAAGYLTKSNQLGVIIEGCPEGNNAWSHTLSPLISRLGLKPAKEERLACTTGFASAGPAVPAINNALLAFRQAGVDRVMFVSYNESVVLLLFANDADSQRYYPGYLLSSGAQAGSLRSNLPQSQWPQLHGVGFSPFTDTDGAHPTTVDKRCDHLVRAGGVVPASYLDEAFVVSECGPFVLLEAALERTNGHATAREVMAGINALGAGFAAPGVIAGRASFTGTKHDGPDTVQAFDYVASCTCMRYSGRPHRAPA